MNLSAAAPFPFSRISFASAGTDTWLLGGRSVLYPVLSLVLALSVAVVAAGQAIPIPFSSPVVGVSSAGLTVTATGGTSTTTAVCAAGIPTTGGVNYGDGCLPSQAYLSNASTTALAGALVDTYGDVFIIDTGHRLIRVIYNGSPYVAAAITNGSAQIANQTGTAVTPIAPVVGNIYTIAGGFTAALASPYYCGNGGATAYSSGIGPALKGTDSSGSGCPAQATYIGGGVGFLDPDGNLIFEDGNILRLLCINCAAGTYAYNTYATAYSTGTTAAQLKNGYLYRLGASTGSGGNLYSTPATAVLMTNGANFLYNEAGIAVDTAGNIYFPNSHFSNLQAVYEGPTCTVGSTCTLPLANIIAATNPGLTTITKGALYLIAGSGCPVSGNTATTCTNTTSGSYPASGQLATSSSGPTGIGNTLGGNSESGVAVDAAGNVYYNDTNSHIVRVIYGGVAPPVGFASGGYSNPTVGYVYTILGGGSTTAINGVGALSASLTKPTSISIDRNGNVLVTDVTLQKILELPATTATVSGPIVLLAGGASAANGTAPNGSYCSGSSGPKNFDLFNDGCPATQLKLNSPYGAITSDTQGNLYVADASNGILRKLTFGTQQSVNVGSTSVTQSTAVGFLSNATLASVPLSYSTTEFADAGSDTCTSSQAVTTATTCVANYTFTPTKAGARAATLSVKNSSAATLGTQAFSGQGIGGSVAFDGTALQTGGSGIVPLGIAVDSSGNVYVADQTSRSVFKYIGGIQVTPALITGSNAYSGVAVDPFGNVFVADPAANTITEVTAAGTTAVVLSGPVAGVSLSSPKGLAADSLGNLYIADQGNNRVLRMAAGTGTATVLPTQSISISGSVNSGGTQPSTTLSPGTETYIALNAPQAVAVDASGNIFIADTGNKRVVEVVASLPGSFAPNYYNPLTVVQNNGAAISVTGAGIAVDAADNLYVDDSGTGNVIAFPSGSAFYVVGPSSTATTPVPQGLAIDTNGKLYIADSASTGYGTYTRMAGSYVFPGLGTSTTLQLLTTGNAAVIPQNTSSLFSLTDAADYTLNTTSCASAFSSGSLSAGMSCNLPVSITSGTPSAPYPYTDIVGISYQSAPGSSSYTTTSITFTALATPGAPASIAVVSGAAQSSPAMTAFSRPVVVKVTDANGVPVPSVSVTFSGTGLSFSPSTISTGSNGQASTTVTPTAEGGLTGSAAASGVVTPATFSLTGTQPTLTVAGTAVSRSFDTTANLSGAYTISGFLPGDTQANSTIGSPGISTSAQLNSTAGVYSTTLSVGTLASSRYFFSFTPGTLTVTGGTAQTILFYPIPSFSMSASPTITLTARSTSGRTISYSASGATISGNKLTPTGPGTVTVTASQPGDATFSAATPVVVRFTATP